MRNSGRPVLKWFQILVLMALPTATGHSDATEELQWTDDYVRGVVQSRIESLHCHSTTVALPPDYELLDGSRVLLPSFVGELDWPGLRRIPRLRRAFWYKTAFRKGTPPYDMALLFEPCRVRFVRQARDLIDRIDLEALADADLLETAYAVFGYDQLTRAVEHGPYFQQAVQLPVAASRDRPFYGCSVVDDVSTLQLSSSQDIAVLEGDANFPPSVKRTREGVGVSFLCVFADLKNAIWSHTVRIDSTGEVSIESNPSGLKIRDGRLTTDVGDYSGR